MADRERILKNVIRGEMADSLSPFELCLILFSVIVEIRYRRAMHGRI